MQVNVFHLLKSSVGAEIECEVNEKADIAGDGQQHPIRGKLRLVRTDRSILVRGTLHTEVEGSCARCLCPLSSPLTLSITEEYFLLVDIASGLALPPPDEPDSFTIDDHHVLDLMEAIRQYALLVIPMKMLCRPDCAGLCPDCGHNLSQGPCGCPPEEINPQWAALIELKTKQPANERKGTD